MHAFDPGWLGPRIDLLVTLTFVHIGKRGVRAEAAWHNHVTSLRKQTSYNCELIYNKMFYTCTSGVCSAG